MVDTNDLNTFLNADGCKEGDIVVILGEGWIEPKTDPITNRKYKILNIPVECNGKGLTYSPNVDALKVLKNALGPGTDKWIGQKFQVKIYPKTSFGTTKNAILPVMITVKV